jgi:hypothetical protein
MKLTDLYDNVFLIINAVRWCFEYSVKTQETELIN